MADKIKVVRIINRFNLGGPVYNATLLTKYLGEDYETTLIGGVPAEGETDASHILKEYGVEPIVLKSIQRELNPVKDFKAFLQLRKIIKKIKPDIVHTHASKAGFLGRAAAISLKVPVVVHTFHGHVFHSYFGKLKTQLFKQIERGLGRKSSGIISISDIQKYELSEIHKIVPKEKISVIPLGFDLRKFQENKTEKRKAIRDKYNLGEDEVALAIVGRLAPIKDHGYFLEVIERLLPTVENKIRVFIVGDGTERDFIEKEIDRIHQKYPNVFVMTSWVLDVATFIQGMDIICLTSKNEGTPVSIIEAQAAGLPVISTDVGGVRDIVRDGTTGFVIKRSNIETYIEKLRLLIDNCELRKDFSVLGVENVMEKFNYQRLVNDIRNYYKQLLNR